MKAKVRILLWIASVCICALLLLILLQRVSGLRKDTRLKIGDTPTVINSIRPLATLISACYYDEVVLTRNKQRDVNAFGTTLTTVDEEICIIANCSLRAGVDLAKLESGDVSFSGDTLLLRLPEPEIFEIRVNPADYEIFVENGRWSHEEVTSIISQAKGVARRDALEAGVLGRADQSARKRIQSLLNAMGYKNVVFLPGGVHLPPPESVPQQ